MPYPSTPASSPSPGPPARRRGSRFRQVFLNFYIDPVRVSIQPYMDRKAVLFLALSHPLGASTDTTLWDYDEFLVSTRNISNAYGDILHAPIVVSRLY